MSALFRLRLPDVDRERYGCKEWLDVDFDAVTNWDAALMQRGFTKDGIRVTFDSPREWLKSLLGEIVTDENDAPIMDPTTGPDGEITLVPRRRPDLGAELTLVWLALRHNGTDVPMSDVDYHLGGMEWDLIRDERPADDEAVPGESEGKGDAGSPSESGNTPISKT